MSQANIQFAAAEWRGMIGDDFTFGRVRALAKAMARLARAKRKRPKLLVAYDTRFLSREFARAAASTLESEGARALLADRAAPAAAVSLEILRRKLDGGLYVTAGHDPAEYNGLRWIEADGAATDPKRAAEIERLAANPAGAEPDAGEGERLAAEEIDPSPAYLERLAELVRVDAIGRAGLEVVYDAMHGAGAGWLDQLFLAGSVPVHILNADRDVLFDGRAPDPVPANLDCLADALADRGAALGLATGGDGRRFGIVDSESGFIPAAYIAGLIYDYLVESRGWRLGIAQGAAAAPLVDAVAHHHGLPVYRTASGFEPLASLLARDQVAAGVDEDGGLTIRGHVPESDGILACLLVAEMVAERGPIDGQLKKLLRRLGKEGER
ncbi:MAG TPA: phosphoglucomutase/phosphomannomutase family protein [Candidatus Dormibacteraeota bacterium]|nr:phosphoglucomutase/phosphomannomutase family protein [Candidatus Dormibacteraeota bacterium]